MKRALTLMSLALYSGALAASEDRTAAEAPAATVDMIYVYIFLALFVGSIVGFCVYFLFKKDKEEETRDR